MTRLRSPLFALAWLVIAVLVTLGTAGIATALNPPPDRGARAELTWAGDRAATVALDAATTRLEALTDAVDALGDTSRQALTSLVAGDNAALATTLATGTAQLAAVTAAADGLERALADVPFTGDDAALRVSSATIARFGALVAAPGLTRNLEADWALLSARAMAASAVPDLLARHDRQTADAARRGGAGHYAAALALLDTSDALIAQSRVLRDSLAQNADMTTLSAWIDRGAAYDAALRGLYTAMVQAKGKVTAEVRTAFAALEAAKTALPADTRAVTVIMGDIARGGLNQAVIDIEVARGALAAALATQRAGPGGWSSPAPSASAAPPASAAPGSPGTASPP